jgi:F-type H+-transporting ATPase subunit b
LDKLGVNTPWLLAQIVNFGLLLFLLWRFAYKPVLRMLETRKQKIQESLDYAERVKRDAADQQKEFERKLDEARRETQAAATVAAQVAEKERTRIIAEAQEDARKIREQAREQIEYERKQMLTSVREEVVHLSILAAQKVIGQTLDESGHRQMVADFIAQAGELDRRN